MNVGLPGFYVKGRKVFTQSGESSQRKTLPTDSGSLSLGATHFSFRSCATSDTFGDLPSTVRMGEESDQFKRTEAQLDAQFTPKVMTLAHSAFNAWDRAVTDVGRMLHDQLGASFTSEDITLFLSELRDLGKAVLDTQSEQDTAKLFKPTVSYDPKSPLGLVFSDSISSFLSTTLGVMRWHLQAEYEGMAKTLFSSASSTTQTSAQPRVLARYSPMASSTAPSFESTHLRPLEAHVQQFYSSMLDTVTAHKDVIPVHVERARAVLAQDRPPSEDTPRLSETPIEHSTPMVSIRPFEPPFVTPSLGQSEEVSVTVEDPVVMSAHSVTEGLVSLVDSMKDIQGDLETLELEVPDSSSVPVDDGDGVAAVSIDDGGYSDSVGDLDDTIDEVVDGVVDGVVDEGVDKIVDTVADELPVESGDELLEGVDDDFAPYASLDESVASSVSVADSVASSVTFEGVSSDLEGTTQQDLPVKFAMDDSPAIPVRTVTPQDLEVLTRITVSTTGLPRLIVAKSILEFAKTQGQLLLNGSRVSPEKAMKTPLSVDALISMVPAYYADSVRQQTHAVSADQSIRHFMTESTSNLKQFKSILDQVLSSLSNEDLSNLVVGLVDRNPLIRRSRH